jgi:HD-GYP domain-containing protein (c-di-GMP phosphodiesterase class II)
VRLVSLDNLEIGSPLAQDVYASGHGDIPLLRRGVAITARYRAALAASGVASVWVEDELGAGIVPHTPVTEATRRKASEAVGTALAEAKGALQGGKGLSDNALTDLSEVAGLVTHEVMNLPDAALHLADMMGADQYLLQHVVDVTALGVVLARRTFHLHGWVDFTGRRRFDGIEGRLSKIALGLLLHDIGKLSIPQEILNKQGALDDDEWAVMRTHPVVGCDLLGDDISFLVRAVVRHHHERWDGTGYPDRLAGEKIHQFARIASVADVYDAVTSARAYKEAAPPHVGVGVVQRGSGTAFDPEVASVFSRVVVPYPPGYEVLLEDGRTGVVLDVDLDDVRRPKVRVRNDDGSIEEIERAVLHGDGALDERAAA